MVMLREGLARLEAELRWIPSALQLGDGLTKLNAGDYLRSIMAGGLYQVQDEAAAMKERASAKEQRLLRGAQRKEAAAARKTIGATGSTEAFCRPCEHREHKATSTVWKE